MNEIYIKTAIISITLILSGCGLIESDEKNNKPDVYADILFHNGTIVTMEASHLTAEAIAIVDNKIIAVGKNVEILAYEGPESEVIDLDGRTIMPGIIDPHTHIFNDAHRLELNLEEAQAEALENGITTVADMYIAPDFLDEMRAFDQSGALKLRTSLYLVATDNCGDPLGTWYMAHPSTHEPGAKLRVEGVKIFTDGGSCGKPAVTEPEVEGGGLGDLWHTQDQLNAMVGEAHDAGFQVAIHAIGDRGVEAALNAIEHALNGQPNSQRHRIEHNKLIRDDLLTRYSSIGVVAIIFTWIPACNDYVYTPFGQTTNRRWRDLIDANSGLHIAWHSDYPWVGPLNPFQQLYSVVTRGKIDSNGDVCPPFDWSADQAITVGEALPMFTIDAAYSIFREDEVGSLESGKYADLIVLSGNPLSVSANNLKDIDVLLTMIDGQVEYQKDDLFPH